MKAFTFKLPEECEQYDEIEIVPFADTHIGDSNCEFKKVKEMIEYVKNRPNAFAVLNGDLMNNSIVGSVGSVWGELVSPMEQINLIVNTFSPIADKVICVTCGNHEKRTEKQTSIDVSLIYANQMNLLDRYTKEGCLVFLECGRESRGRIRNGSVRKITYRLACLHGYGSGRTIGAKLNSLDRFSHVIDSDIYIMSHTHLPAVFKEDYLKTDDRNRTLNKASRLYVNTNAWLGYGGGYAEAYGFVPASIDVPIIRVGNHKKWYTAEL